MISVVSLALGAAVLAGGSATVPPLPPTVRVYAGAKATVDGQPAPLRASAYNPDRENWSWDPPVVDSGVLQFTLRKQTRVVLTGAGLNQPGKVVVRPEKGVRARATTNGLVLEVLEPGGWLVEPVNAPPIHVFAAPPSAPPAPGSGGVLTYGPGFHDVGEVKIGKGIRMIYIDPAATIRGHFKLDGSENITLTGGGTIDNGTVVRGKGSGFTIFAIACKNVRIENLTLLDNPGWNVVLAGSEDVTIRNVRILGARATSDGFDICNSRRVDIRNCFVRNFDDCIAIKGVEPFGMGPGNVEDLTVRDSTFLTDNGWGQAFAVGFETFADRIHRVTIENCDVLHCTTLLTMYLAERARIEQFVVRDIRVAMPKPRSFVKVLVEAHKDWNKGVPTGFVDGLTLSGIDVEAPTLANSILRGTNEQASVRNVVFDRIRLRGKPVRPRVELGPFAARPEGSE